MALAKYYEDNRIINEERETSPRSFFSAPAYRWKPTPEVLEEEHSAGICSPVKRKVCIHYVRALPVV